MSLSLSHYIVVTDTVHDSLDGREKRILFGTRTGTIKAVDIEWWKRLSMGDFASLPSHLLEELEEAKVIVDSHEDELASILAENRAAIANLRRLALGVHPTANCQLACDYCGQMHRAQKLSPEDQERFIRRARKKLLSGRYRELKVCWTGGEPLLAMDVIRNMSKKFKALANEFGCAYISDIMTNGLLLTEEVATELSKEHGIIHADVTLDGTDIYHDKRRCDKKGFPSFWKIFNNIVALAQQDDLGMELAIRCNVDYRNRDAVKSLIQLLADYRIQDRIEMLYMAPVHAWTNNSDEISEDPRELASLEIEWLSEMKRLGFKNVNFIPQRKMITCFALNRDAELVNAYAELFNCSDFCYVPDYEKPVIKKGSPKIWSNIYSIGSLAKGEELGKRNLLAKFNDRVERGEIPCHTCEILPVCCGSCPKRWLEGRVACPSIKFNILNRLILRYRSTSMSGLPSYSVFRDSRVAVAMELNFQNCLAANYASGNGTPEPMTKK